MEKLEKFTLIWAIISFMICLIFTGWCITIESCWLQTVIGIIGFVGLVSTGIALSVFARRVYERLD